MTTVNRMLLSRILSCRVHSSRKYCKGRRMPCWSTLLRGTSLGKAMRMRMRGRGGKLERRCSLSMMTWGRLHRIVRSSSVCPWVLGVMARLSLRSRRA